MKDELVLVVPSQEHKDEIMKFKNEFIQNGERIINGSAGLDIEDNFENWLKDIKEDETREYSEPKRARFPGKVFLAYRKSDNRLVGIVQLREKLDDYLLKKGHIGDSVRPTERNKGYSTQMIGLAIEEAKKLGIGNVLMVCHNGNFPSARTIIKNGGVFEDEIIRDGDTYQRYWITLKKRYADGRNKPNDILEKEFKNFRVDNDEFQGNISLLTIKKVREEWRVDEEQRCILAKNYNWLEIYPDGEHFCISAVLDEKDNIVEWYIDIARMLGEEEGVPYEDDLYLDVVIVPDGRIHLLDEDELEDAYNRKEVSKKEFDMAYETANRIMEKARKKENIKKLTEFTHKYLEILKEIEF